MKISEEKACAVMGCSPTVRTSVRRVCWQCLPESEAKVNVTLPVVVERPSPPLRILSRMGQAPTGNSFLLFDTEHSIKARCRLSPASTREVNARSRGSGATNKYFIRGTPSIQPPFGIGMGGRGGSEFGKLSVGA